jgi:hypothetical protein
MKVSPRLKATISLMPIEVVKFAMRSSARAPYLARQLSVFYPGNLPRVVPEVDVCGLAEIGNSKERHMARNLDRFGP